MIPWRGRGETDIAREGTTEGGSPWRWGVSSTQKVGGGWRESFILQGPKRREVGRFGKMGKFLTSSFNFLNSMN